MQLWDLRVKRSVQTFSEKYQVLSVAFAEAGDQVDPALLETQWVSSLSWLPLMNSEAESPRLGLCCAAVILGPHAALGDSVDKTGH